MAPVNGRSAEPPRDRSAAAGSPRVEEAASGAGTLLVDAHVHLHREHRLATLLDAAVANFDEARRTLEPAPSPASWGYALLLTEILGPCVFDALANGSDEAATSGAGGWRFERTGEALSLIARAADRRPLILVRGRQIVTRESIEVLALLCSENVPDGLPLDETLARVRAGGALPVLPWGFGKWWRERGRAVERRLREDDPGALFLGDNGGRPRIGPEPAMFRLARRLGYRVLPGSDPLPLPGHERRPGSYGLRLAARIDPDAPASSIRRALLEAPPRPASFGRRRPLLAFARDQLAMQRRKRLRRSS
jgi:hypothetical protein